MADYDEKKDIGIGDSAQEVNAAENVRQEAAVMAAAVDQPSVVDDPKEYVEAPFVQNRNNESVGLNSGALTYTVTDFVLPGKNGFDLAISRRYDSSQANSFDVHQKLNETGKTYTYDIWIEYTCICGDKHKEKLDHKAGVKFNTKEAAVAAAAIDLKYYKEETDGGYLVKGYSDGMWSECPEGEDTIKNNYPRVWTDPPKKIDGEQGKKWETTTRANDHNTNLYGLGYGWSLCLPSIEAVKQEESKVKYKNFLHIGDGRVYEIDLDNQLTGLKNYSNKDIILRSASNTSGWGTAVPYNYVLELKGGIKHCLRAIDASKSEVRSSLVSSQDRFENTIAYDFSSNGITITDTLGKKITLKKSASELTWELPDNKTVKYRITDNLLRESIDLAGNTTTFYYANYQCYSAPFYNLGDKGVHLDYKNLTSIIYPTGAKSIYNYSNEIFNTEYGDYQRCVVTNRYDLQLNSSRILNYESFVYNLTNHSKGGYISTCTVTKANLTETHTFDKDGLRTGEIIKNGSTVVSNKSFTYTKKLLTGMSMTAPYAASETYEYDDKANLSTHWDVLGNKTTYEYSKTYSLPLTKKYLRDTGIEIIEQSTLTADQKSIALVEIKENDVLKQENHVLKQKTGFEYKASGAVSRQTEYDVVSGGAARVTDFVYQNGQDVFVRQKTVGGKPLEISVYDDYGNLREQIAPNGNTTEFAYDALGRVTKQTNPDGTTKGKSYSTVPHRIIETDENGHRKQYDYTGTGKIATVSLPDTDVTLAAFEYDVPLERLLRETTYAANAANNAVTTYSYDHFDRVKSKRTTSAGIDMLEQYDYNDAARTEAKTVCGDAGAPDIQIVTVKDVAGRVVSEQSAGNTVSYSYDFLGNRKTAQSTLDAQRGAYAGRWTYDFAGRALNEMNALGLSSASDYDSFGNKKWQTDFKGTVTNFEYDVLGRLLRQTSPFSGQHKAVTEYDYDANGNVTEQRVLCSKPGEAAVWRRSINVYDNRSRLVKTRLFDLNRSENSTEYVYDSIGNKTAVITGITTQEAGLQTAYGYDHFGNVCTVTDPMGGVEACEYDRFGRLVRKTDRGGNVSTFEQDGLGRITTQLTTALDGDFSRLTFGYARNGSKRSESLTETRKGAQATLASTFGYDNAGRLIQQQDPEGVVKTYDYDLHGNRTAFTLSKNGKSEITLTYNYDKMNRLVELLRGGVVQAKYTYDDNGNRSRLEYPQSGIATGYAYNDANLVTRLENKKADAVRSTFAYEYYLDGNQSTKTDKDGKITAYEYDGLGRLVQETAPNSDFRYSYDRFSNRKKLVSTGADSYETTYEYDACNRLLREEKLSKDAKEIFLCGYDDNGNQTTRTHEEYSKKKPGVRARVGFVSDDFHEEVATVEMRGYNAVNRLVWVYVDGVQAQYEYRPDGLRHRKTVQQRNGAASVHTHLWDGQNMVAEAGVNGQLFARYIRGINLVARDIDGNSQYYLYNAHGDVAQRTDENGVQLKNYDYDAFGVELAPEKLDCNPFRYCGEYMDLGSGDYYLRNRYYSPVNGRFTSEDSIRGISTKLPDGKSTLDTLSLNLYTYCHNNPIKYADPSGKSRVSLEDYLKSQDYKNLVTQSNEDPSRLEYEIGLRAKVHPLRSKVAGTSYSNHGNSLDFSAPLGTSIHSVTGGIVEQIDWGYSDDYKVRAFEVERANGSKYTVYYEVDDQDNIKYDANDNPIIGKPYGNSIRIRIDDGDGDPTNDAVAIYAHLAYSEFAPVEVGFYIPIDGIIGTVGNTGNSFGAHLHFEVRNTTNSVSDYIP